VIAHETGVTSIADPLGGSWLVESLTDELERQAYDYFDRIDRLGGVVAALNENFFQREIAEASFQFQQEVESGRRAIVGVNSFTEGDDQPLETLQVPFEVEERQVARLRAVRGRTQPGGGGHRAGGSAAAAAIDENVMPHLIECARPTPARARSATPLRSVWVGAVFASAVF
jgi:methylmalonyl-CoA mutase N-terminal domain/subunit